MSQYQIIATTIWIKGDNTYLHNKSGLDFGVQVSYHESEDNTGFERVVEPTAEIIVNERIKNGLKNEILSILSLTS